MSTSRDLKDIFAAGRPLVECWLDVTRQLNLMFMRAWRSGDLDATWSEYRKTAPDLWLTYYIRARGMGDIKIGKSNHLRSRFLALFTGASRGLDLVACYPSSKYHEAELKEEFASLRLTGEWFRPGNELLTHLSLIGADVDGFTNSTPAHFTRLFPERT